MCSGHRGRASILIVKVNDIPDTRGGVMKKLLSVVFVVSISLCLTQYSFGDVSPPTYQAYINLGNCFLNPDACERPVDQYGNGQTIMSMMSDVQSDDFTANISAEAGAGGGLEPAVSARAYADGSSIASASASINDWAYWIGSPDEIPYSASIQIEYNWSIEGAGVVTLGGRRPGSTNYAYYNYFNAKQSYFDGVLKYSILGSAWAVSTGTIEGSYTQNLVTTADAYFYMYIGGRADGGGGGRYSQVAIDPFISIAPSDPNASKLQVTTIKSLYDFSLIEPVRGSALVAPVPIPSAVWLLGSGLIGIVGIRKKFKK